MFNRAQQGKKIVYLFFSIGLKQYFTFKNFNIVTKHQSLAR